MHDYDAEIVALVKANNPAEPELHQGMANATVNQRVV
jgi:hypothetical protein